MSPKILPCRSPQCQHKVPYDMIAGLWILHISPIKGRWEILCSMAKTVNNFATTRGCITLWPSLWWTHQNCIFNWLNVCLMTACLSGDLVVVCLVWWVCTVQQDTTQRRWNKGFSSFKFLYISWVLHLLIGFYLRSLFCSQSISFLYFLFLKFVRIHKRKQNRERK